MKRESVRIFGGGRFGVLVEDLVRDAGQPYPDRASVTEPDPPGTGSRQVAWKRALIGPALSDHHVGVLAQC